jgi:FRG domain
MLIDAYLERNEAQRRINSPEECLDLLRDFTGLEEDKYHVGSGRGMAHLFRGHDDASYPLQTTLDRKVGRDKRRAEDYLLQQFKRQMHQYLPSESLPTSDLGVLALMQHYGVPTRLLDVTRSPYVALYFAVRDVSIKADAAVWVFNTINIQTTSLRRICSKDPELVKVFGRFCNPRAEFPSQKLFQKLFMPDVSYGDLQNPESLQHQEIIFALEPFTMNPRLTVQQGLFLVSASPCNTFEETLIDILQETESKISETGGHEPSVFKIVIPMNLRRPLMRNLEKMKITAASLFEGLGGFADSLREKIMMMEKDDFLGYIMGLPT